MNMKLTDICEINPKTEALDDNTLVSFVAMPDVSEDGRINVGIHRTYSEVKKGFTSFKEGDVLFAKITPCMENGKGALATGLKNGIGFGSTEFHVLRPNAAIVLGQWLYYLTSWSAFRKDAEKHMTGSAGQKRVPKSFLEKYEVVVPMIEDQKHQVLQLNQIRKIIDARQQQLTALDNLIKARFVEMFGTIHDNKFAYRIMTIQDVCEPIKDGTHQTPEYTDDDENGFKFLSSKDVTSGRIDWNHLKFIPEKLHKELYSRIAPRKGDLLLAKNGTTGIAAIVDRDEVFDIYVSLALLRPTIVDSTYLWGAINSTETKEQFDASLKGIGVPNLHLGEIKKTRIIVPPIEKQQEFATFVTQINKSKSVIQMSLDETQLLFDSLMQKYFG